MVCIAPQMTEAKISNQASAKAQMIDGVYAGFLRYYLPDDPDLYIDCYVYVNVNNPNVVSGVRFNSPNATYRGVTGDASYSEGFTYVNFTSSSYPDIQFSGTLQ